MSAADPATVGGLEDLTTMLRPLWPSAAIGLLARRSPHQSGLTQYVALPGAERATVLLPLRPRRATAAVLAAHRSARTRRDVVLHRAAAELARLGAADALPGRIGVRHAEDGRRDASVPGQLSEVLGQSLVVGVHLGPPRANRKPILQLLSATGRTAGFAKVGVNDLTRGLVRAEAAALRQLSPTRLRHVCVPRVLHAGSWDSTELLVLTPVVTRSSAPPSPQHLNRAMVEVCGVAGMRHRTLASTGYWEELPARVRRLRGAAAHPLSAALDALTKTAADATLPFGAWHGDWTPWNMSIDAGSIVLWDWERFESDVPAGYDALHFAFHVAVRLQRQPPVRAVARLTTQAASLLEPFGVGATSAPLVLMLYLLEIGVRYATDDQQAAGSRLGDLGGWLLPALAGLVAQQPASSP